MADCIGVLREVRCVTRTLKDDQRRSFLASCMADLTTSLLTGMCARLGLNPLRRTAQRGRDGQRRNEEDSEGQAGLLLHAPAIFNINEYELDSFPARQNERRLRQTVLRGHRSRLTPVR